jgi:hypothetical protein
VLLDLAALHWSAEGVRVKFSAGKRTVIDGPYIATDDLHDGPHRVKLQGRVDHAGAAEQADGPRGVTEP